MAGGEKSYSYSDVASSSGGAAAAAIHSHMVNQLQQFDPNPEIYNLTAGMEMIGFPSKNNNLDQSASVIWKGFFNHHHSGAAAADGGPSSSSKDANEPTSSDQFYQFYNRSLLLDDPSCVFPCEENQRPRQGLQGLSLSLNSSNPSSAMAAAGLQAFELRQHVQNNSIQEHSFIKNSKYLTPAQDLLNELVSHLAGKSSDDNLKLHNKKTTTDDENVAVKKQSLYSLDFLELQIRKTKLLQMLEEVDRRYRHYCDQMKAVVSSFESVAGDGAASVYSASASKTMSRHFRCLKDGIVGQIKATKKAMGEKDSGGAGTTTMRGETPRLRMIDQTLRQQRALQQMSSMESHPWRPQRGLPERSVSILRAWLFEHFLHPYPSDVDKHILARQTGLSRSQVSNWFINARVRLWKPMVEEMYVEELKESDAAGGDGAALDSTAAMAENHSFINPSRNDDQKPSHDQLVRIDSDCLSSIVTTPDYNNNKDAAAAAGGRKDKSVVVFHDEHHHHHHRHIQNPSFDRLGDSIGAAMELDFSSYNHHSAANNTYTGVSLTLGLHQHGPDGGLSLGFSPTTAAGAAGSSQNNVSGLFYTTRGADHHMEDCQTVQYSLLDSENQTLPYRNLMGAQLLHDLAG
ncbi:homeobox protein BEL1 homolog [Andrographis paniculata]|uniref:homeobox protein BEL1 homolog n=1 Tax=Andrographis paniculata TaxID=175694 RepID=UPI0021E828E2|nr:homeobox protein BEL1 homolog [Andrographis paniculata]